MKTHSLDSGVSETLKVVPHRKLLSVAMASRGGGTEKIGNVINLHFEGNWMPIKASFTGALAVTVAIGKCGHFARLRVCCCGLDIRAGLCSRCLAFPPLRKCQ